MADGAGRKADARAASDMQRLAVPLPISADIVERRERLLRAERRSAARPIDLGAAEVVRLATELLMDRHGLKRERAYALLVTLAHHKELRLEAMAERFVAAARHPSQDPASSRQEASSTGSKAAGSQPSSTARPNNRRQPLVVGAVTAST
jgi:hypothetical protein